MKTKIMTALLSSAALAALSATASATVMTYTETGTLSGSLGGKSFTNAAVTFRVTANTATIVTTDLGPHVPYWSIAGVTTVDIDGFNTATFNDPHNFGVYAMDRTYYFPAGSVGFGNLDYQSNIVGISHSNERNYNLATEKTFTGVWLFDELASNTTLGELVLTATSGNATFTAVATVPEPSALALLGLGVLGLAARRRRVG